MDKIISIVVNNQSISDTDLIHLHLVNKQMYLSVYEYVNNRYKVYIQSDIFKQKTITSFNHSSYMIDAFEHDNKMLNNMMFEYVITCYDNWHWLSMCDNYRARLKIPSSQFFKTFLEERLLSISDILPKVQIHYTHHHRASKTFSYYKTV